MKLKTPEIGTVIRGTHCNEDLAVAFIRELEKLENPLAAEFRAEWERECFHDPDSDFAFEIVYSLIEVLDTHSPEGVYFGPLEGDGSDFGFWNTLEEFHVVLGGKTVARYDNFRDAHKHRDLYGGQIYFVESGY